MQSGRLRNFSIPRLELQTAFFAVRLREQMVKENEIKINSCSFGQNQLQFCSVNSSRRQQQVLVANRLAEILDKTDVSQWSHVCAINKPAEIGIRAINIEGFNRNEWLTGPAWLNRPKSERPERVNLGFASDEENIPS